MEQKPRTIRYLPISSLSLWHQNPKQHDLPAIRASIERHGFVSPILVDERTMRVIAGHGRLAVLQAMKDEGMDPPDGILADGDEWLVPVVLGKSFPSQREAEAYALADNRLVERGGWDVALLRQVLAEHVDNPTGIGWSAAEIERLLEQTDSFQQMVDIEAIGDLEIRFAITVVVNTIEERERVVSTLAEMGYSSDVRVLRRFPVGEEE